MPQIDSRSLPPLEATAELLKKVASFTTVGVEISTRDHGGGTKAFRISNVLRVLRGLWDLKRRVG